MAGLSVRLTGHCPSRQWGDRLQVAGMPDFRPVSPIILTESVLEFCTPKTIARLSHKDHRTSIFVSDPLKAELR